MTGVEGDGVVGEMISAMRIEREKKKGGGYYNTSTTPRTVAVIKLTVLFKCVYFLLCPKNDSTKKQRTPFQEVSFNLSSRIKDRSNANNNVFNKRTHTHTQKQQHFLNNANQVYFRPENRFAIILPKLRAFSNKECNQLMRGCRRLSSLVLAEI